MTVALQAFVAPPPRNDLTARDITTEIHCEGETESCVVDVTRLHLILGFKVGVTSLMMSHNVDLLGVLSGFAIKIKIAI